MQRSIMAIVCLGMLLAFSTQARAKTRSLRVRVLSLLPVQSFSVTADEFKYQLEGDKTYRTGSQLQVAISGHELAVQDPAGTQRSPMLVLTVAPDQWMTLRLGEQVRQFAGRLRVSLSAGTLLFIQEVDLESYVAGVLASEMPDDFPPEAKKAQAVLIRSYTLSHRGRHALEGYDLCDTTHCQAYAGQRGGGEAAQATRGRVLSYRHTPIAGLYHSTCGGHTSANQKVFGGQALPYLQGVDDGDFCAASPHSQWKSDFSREDLGLALGYFPREIRPVDREVSGRWFQLEVNGKRLPVMDFLSELGKKWGWNRLKSNWFELTETVHGFVFTGRGLGHGVGLCQWGAKGMAERGHPYPEILRHYFPQTRLESY